MLNNSKGKRRRRREERDKDGGRNEVEGKKKGEAGRGEGRKEEEWRPVNTINLETALPVWASMFRTGWGDELEEGV